MSLIDTNERNARQFTFNVTSNVFVSGTNDRRISRTHESTSRSTLRRDIAAMQLYLYRAVPHHTGHCSIYESRKHMFAKLDLLIVYHNAALQLPRSHLNSQITNIVSVLPSMIDYLQSNNNYLLFL